MSLIHIENQKWLEKIYEDLAGPLVKKISTGLSVGLETIGNSLFGGIVVKNEKAKINIQNRIKEYAESLKNIPEEAIIPAPSEIVVPILERFRYVTNKELSNAFVKLLTAASSSETISLAHPGFISIIDRLSPDEAIILTYLKQVKSVPAYTAGWFSDSREAFITLVDKGTLLNERIKLIFDNNISLYFENLISLGLVAYSTGYLFEQENDFTKLKEKYSVLLWQSKPHHVNDQNEEEFFQENRGTYSVSYLGDLFIETCISD